MNFIFYCKKDYLISIFLILTGLFSQFTPLIAQVKVIVKEINPDQSTLDGTDPDGASGGRINGLAIANDGNTCYAASEWGGIYKSLDAGRTWFQLNSHLPVVTWDVEVQPTNPNVVIATSFFDGRVNSLAGINVSTDGGQSWSKPTTATPPVTFNTTVVRRNEPAAFGICFDPDNPQNVYVGTNTGLAISNNAGLTWRFIDPTPADIADNIWDVIIHHNGMIDLVGDDGHQRSVDGGITWTTATPGNGIPSGMSSIAMSPDESYVLFAVVGLRIFESDDGGNTWPTEITNPRPQGRIPFVAVNDRAGNDYDLWFGDVQLHRATCTTPQPPAQGGNHRAPVNTWTGPFTRTAGGHDDCGAIIFNPNANVDACPVLFSSDGGVYYNTLSSSPNCHSPAWEQPNVTPHGLWLWDMAGANQPGTTVEDIYFGCQDNGTFYSANAGSANPTWLNNNCCDGFDVSAESNQILYTVCCCPSCARLNRLYKRNTGMTGGSEINTYPPGNIPRFSPTDVITQFDINDYAIITTNGVFITDDINANPIVWKELGDATNPAGQDWGIHSTKDGNTPIFYIQTPNGNIRSQDNLWKFTDTIAGNAWQRINPPGGIGGFSLFDVDPGNADRIIACHVQPGNNPQIVITNDGGANWTNFTNLDELMTGGGVFAYQNQNGPNYNSYFQGYTQPTLLAFDPNNRNIIIAGAADAGVFLSVDGGNNWQLVTNPFSPGCVNPERPHIPRPEFAYFDHEPSSLFSDNVNVYIGTQGRGIWRLSFEIRNRWINICDLNPDLCHIAVIERELIELDCVTSRMCIIRDPMDKNCLYKWDCPGCSSTKLCPPFYNIYLDGFKPDIWNVGIITKKGLVVDFTNYKTRKGVILTFRPDEKLFNKNKLNDYELIFFKKGGVISKKQKIRTRITASDMPYQPGPGERILTF